MCSRHRISAKFSPVFQQNAKKHRLCSRSGLQNRCSCAGASYPRSVRPDTDTQRSDGKNPCAVLRSSHCPVGSVIEIHTDQKEQWVTVSVSDNGPGIPDEQKPRIFDMFYSGANKVVDSRRSLVSRRSTSFQSAL